MPPSEIAEFIAAVLAPGRFFVKPPQTLRVEERPAETRRWEIYKGELLQPEQTRAEKTLHSWLLLLDEPEKPAMGPTLSVRWDQDKEALYVTRGFAIHGHEAYGEGNVIQTRPCIKWLEELVGTVDLGRAVRNEEELVAELNQLLAKCLLGTSRLAISSVESPHPEYAHGRFMLCRRIASDDEKPQCSLTQFLDAHERWPEPLAALDFTLRLAEDEEVGELASCLKKIQAKDSIQKRQRFLAGLFNQLSLTPDVGQARRLLALLERSLPPAEYAERLAHWLRQLAWHLTAYDLRRFHNQGANYPDALFLDDLLSRLVASAATHAVTENMHRALRLGSLLRRELQDLAIPARPTSPGENQRVSLRGAAPLADAEMLEPASRSRRLFADAPFASAYAFAQDLFRQAWNELEGETALLELGRATYLDRPLGVFKELRGWRRDQTPLVSYRAFSRSIAAARLESARQAGWIDAEREKSLAARLVAAPLPGVAAEELPLPRPRQGVVSLEDARLAAPDFIFVASSPVGWENILHLFEWRDAEPLLLPDLIIRSPRSRLLAEPRAVITGYARNGRPCVEYGLPWGVSPHEVEYVERAGEETLLCGLDVLHCWDQDGDEVSPLPEPTRFRPFR